MTWFRADRAFDSFDAGQVVELSPDTDEQHARWVRTGYLEQIEDPDGAAPDGPPAVADQPTSTESAAPGVPGEPDQEVPGGDVQDADGAGPVARTRRRS